MVSMFLLRLLPIEWAHTLAIWSIRTGFYRVGLWVDWLAVRVVVGLLLAYAKPGMWLKAKWRGGR
jgi:hypothetical protein